MLNVTNRFLIASFANTRDTRGVQLSHKDAHVRSRLRLIFEPKKEALTADNCGSLYTKEAAFLICIF